MFIAVLDGGCHSNKFCCLGGNGVILAEEGGSEVSETSSQGVCHASVTSVSVEEGGYEGGGELREREGEARGGREGGGEVEGGFEVGREEGRGGGGEVEVKMRKSNKGNRGGSCIYLSPIDHE